MGSDLSRPSARMAVASMSHVVNFSQGELWKLRKRFRELAAREGDPNTITQAEFHDALEAVGVHEDGTSPLAAAARERNALGRVRTCRRWPAHIQRRPRPRGSSRPPAQTRSC